MFPIMVPILSGLAVIVILLWYGFSKNNREARCESPIEKRLYRALTNKGYSPIPQKWIGKYRVDLCLPIYRLVIECDGLAFHSSPAQKKHDKRRTSYLNRQGWKVIRFTGSQINKSPYTCVNAIENKINKIRA